MVTKKKKKGYRIKKGDKYVCGICGLAVRVDQVCGCSDVCDITCCGQQMKKKLKKSRR